VNLVFVRHGIAEDRKDAEHFGLADEARPLTAEGRKRMKKVAAGLRESVGKVALIATSSLLRAVQTAEILAKSFGDPPMTETASLAPGAAPSVLLDWLREQHSDDTIVLVGHEPDLSQWISWALTGKDRPLLTLRKGGACMLEFDKDVTPGTATLHWVMAPKQLRSLA
jgi:phosphohistidine phosphatase